MESLKRELGVFGAVMLGLGSIVGTGVFVSVGIAAGITGPSVVAAVALAALVATCNGLSSAQLAAQHPVSGGTYEYGYRFLTPAFGAVAGFMFLAAKSASAATAALGFAGYLLGVFRVPAGSLLVPIALAGIVVLVAVVLGGIRRSALTNTVIVSVTLLTLLFFVFAALPRLAGSGLGNFTPFLAAAPGQGGVRLLVQAAALMFVAYTGYGRIATLGEEVKNPAVTIPRAIGVTLLVTMVLYVAVSGSAVATLGAPALAQSVEQQAAPLEIAARDFALPWAPAVLAVGAVTAMLGVLLNLILGLSRVLLAMGRRGEMPAFFTRVSGRTGTPWAAVLGVGVVIAALALIGDVKLTWSFSAFTVLVYYSITNLAALVLPNDARLFPRWISAAGLVGCLSLAVFIQRDILLVGLAVVAGALAWHLAARFVKGSART